MKLPFRLPPRLRALWEDEKQRANLLVALGVAGMLLIAVPEWVPKRTAEPTPEVTDAQTVDYAAALEDRLQALLTQVEGAGEVRVMVTLAAGEQTVYALDTENDADGASREKHLLLDGASGPALVERVAAPAVQGVAVVCTGGASAVVQSRVTAIVAALTGVGESHITVTPMVTPK